MKEGVYMAQASETRDGPSSEASVAELVKQLSEQTSRLARQEVELAKAEVAAKGKRAGIGAGLFGAAGIVGFYAVGAVVAAVILALSTMLAGWLAALIVGVVLLAVSAAAALLGKGRLQRATPPVPDQAVGSLKADVEEIKQRAHP